MSLTKIIAFSALGMLSAYASVYSSSSRIPDDIKPVAQQAADAFQKQDF